MEPSTYNAFADMLAKFQSSPEWIKALSLVTVPATVVGVTWCLAQVPREAIRALSGRRGAALDLEAIETSAVPRLGTRDGAEEPLRLAAPDRPGAAEAPGRAAAADPSATGDDPPSTCPKLNLMFKPARLI